MWFVSNEFVSNDNGGSFLLRFYLASLFAIMLRLPSRINCPAVWDFSCLFFSVLFFLFFIFFCLYKCHFVYLFLLWFQACSKLATNNANSSAYISRSHEQQVLSNMWQQKISPKCLGRPQTYTFTDYAHCSDFMSFILCRQYVGKADFLVFRAMNQHGFLGQLQEKKLVSSFKS